MATQVICPDWIFVCPYLDALRASLLERLSYLFHAPADAFAAGLLIGARTQMPLEVMEEFRATGLMHIVAISGFNMVLVVTAVERLLTFLPRRVGIAATLIATGLFTLLVGASGAVLRAYVMCSVRLIARIVRRPSGAPRALFLTVVFLVAAQPSVAADIGFQLSVAATSALLFIAPKMTEKLYWVPEKFGMRGTLAGTISVEITTVPLIAFHFQTISLIAPVANLLIVPFVPVLMLGSGLSLAFGIIAAAPIQIVFDVVLWVIHLLSSVPYAII